MIKKLNFHNYCKFIRTNALGFRKEWDDEEWNQSYIAFKACLDIMNTSYKRNHTYEYLILEFAKDFYQDAHPETHNYWLRI